MQGLVLEDAHSQLDDLRARRRFKIIDESAWELKINDKVYPLEWIHDLSSKGMQLRQGLYNSFSTHEKVRVELYFMGRVLANVRGVIRWTKRDQSRLNMKILGLEFDDKKGRIRKALKATNPYFTLEPLPDHRDPPETPYSFYSPLAHVSGAILTIFSLMAFATGIGFGLI